MTFFYFMWQIIGKIGCKSWRFLKLFPYFRMLVEWLRLEGTLKIIDHLLLPFQLSQIIVFSEVEELTANHVLQTSGALAKHLLSFACLYFP